MTANSSQRRPGTDTSQIPSTLWALGADPLDPDDRWPRPVLSHAVREFSAPGSRVLLIGWPAPRTRGTVQMVESDTTAALAQIRDLDRLSAHAPGGDWTDSGEEPVDLVIASLLADHHDPMTAVEYVAALATEVMAMGALLIVLSRCRHSEDGVLLDPAGSVVAAAQGADLLYLQHIIAAPVTGRTVVAAAPDDPVAPGLPRHTVAHTDVFVFLNPEHG